MRTLVCTEPGKFTYATAEKPQLKKGQAIIRIRRIGICGTDLHAFEGTQPYFTYPRILGHELAGELIDADSADDFQVGETVSFIPYFSCGKCIACRNGKPNCCVDLKVCGVHADGGMAEYFSVPSSSLLHGEGLSYDELALVEPLAVGVHGINRAAVLPGEFVLVVGAGPIGLGTLQAAQLAGAIAIAMDTNEQRLQFCKSKLYIAHTLNPVTENAFAALMELTEGDMPTVVIDASGNNKAINNSFQYMAHGARYVLIGLQKEKISFSHPEFHKREGTLLSSRNAVRNDFDQVIKSIREGKVNPAIYITHRVKFEHVKEEFSQWLDPASGVIKAMVEM